MYVIILGVLVHNDIFNTKFACDYEACKGACCWVDIQGSLGGELLKEEAAELRQKKTVLNSFVSPELRVSQLHLKQSKWGNKRFTPLKDGVCVYSHSEKKSCCLKSANEKNILSFGIPLHCELYPIELVEKKEVVYLELLTTWNKECTPAFIKGSQLDIPVFRWCKNAIIRRFGEDFYKEMERNYQLQ